ncbi:MAG: DUF4976 domain-containing protein, partial [Chloroflexota bacterium]
AMEAKQNRAKTYVDKASIMMVQEDYKLVKYYGYLEIEKPGYFYELYNLKDDPGELDNIYDPGNKIAQELMVLLEKNAVEKANQVRF